MGADSAPVLARTASAMSRVSDELMAKIRAFAVGLVIAAEKQLNEFQSLLVNWRLLATRAGKSTELGEYVGPIDSQQREGRAQMGAMRALAGRCLAEARPYDPAGLRTPVAMLSQANAELSRTAASVV